MRNITVAAGIINQLPLDLEGNSERIVALIAEAKSAAASILCLPEMAITGYGCEDMFLSPDLGKRALRELQKIALETRGMIVAVGLPLWFQRSVYNAVALLVDGEIAGFSAKQSLAGDGILFHTENDVWLTERVPPEYLDAEIETP